MMKFTLGPKHLTEMLRKALINAKQLESISAIISPSGIHFSDISLGVTASDCFFSRGYFEGGYSVDEEYEVLIKRELLEAFEKLRFPSEDSVTVEVDKNEKCFHIVGGGKDWHPKMFDFKLQTSDASQANYNHADTRINFKTAEVTGIGTLPIDPNRPIMSQFAIGVDKLVTPDVEKVSIRVGEAEATSLELDFLGPFKQALTPTKKRKMTPGVYTLFVDKLQNILANFAGEVWVTIYERVIFFTMIEESYSLSYLSSVT